ncbi:MAG TPA: diacylglycerol kinase [Allosphingosinicella sp.]
MKVKLILPSQAKNRPFAVRLGFAVAGIRTVKRREKSFRTQSMLGGGAAAALVLLRPGLVWAALVLLSTGLVLALEAVNGALEYLADRVHPDWAEEIGHAKDAAAGAVLIASLAAAAVGALMAVSVLL